MGLKRTRQGTSLTYHATLPVETEPEYQEGYSCDMCRQDYSRAPFYHNRESGEDRCLRCSIGSGIHPVPRMVRQCFVSCEDDDRMVAMMTAVLSGDRTGAATRGSRAIAPVLAYRTQQDDVGILFSDNSCLVLEVSDVAIRRGYYRSAQASHSIEEIEGSDLLDKFPSVETWGNPSELMDESHFHRKSFGSLPKGSSSGNGLPFTPIFLKGVDMNNGIHVFALSSGDVQVHNVVNGRYALWKVEEEEKTAQDAKASSDVKPLLLLAAADEHVNLLKNDLFVALRGM